MNKEFVEALKAHLICRVGRDVVDPWSAGKMIDAFAASWKPSENNPASYPPGSTAEAWESGELGLSKEHAQRAPKEIEVDVIKSLGLTATDTSPEALRALADSWADSIGSTNPTIAGQARAFAPLCRALADKLEAMELEARQKRVDEFDFSGFTFWREEGRYCMSLGNSDEILIKGDSLLRVKETALCCTGLVPRRKT